MKRVHRRAHLALWMGLGPIMLLVLAWALLAGVDRSGLAGDPVASPVEGSATPGDGL